MNYFVNRQQRVKRHFTIAWFILTLFFLITFVFYQKQQFEQIRSQQITIAALAYQLKIDALFNRLLNPARRLSLGAHCERILKPQLEAIDFENPSISGLVISDKDNKIICSTTDHESLLPLPSGHDTSLIGPLHATQGENGIYLLQKQLGSYYYGVYLLGRIITRNLTKSPNIKAIALEDNKSKQLIFQSDDFDGQKENLIRQPLERVGNINLLLNPNESAMEVQFIVKELLWMIALILLAILLYFYIRRILTERFSLKAAIEMALHHNKFKPYYLPTWNEKAKQFTAAEVLMRWHINDEDVIPPDLFIMEAEKSGLIVPMTINLIEQSLKDSQSFLKRNPDFYLSFNLSIHHFTDPLFFKRLYNLFRDYQINPNQIMFELTERELLNEFDEPLKAQLNELVQCGCFLAIDDFGTGHSSINYLRHFPFTHLKIDKIFIQSIGTGAITESLSYSIIQLANTIKLTIIAEGVETKEQYDYLKNNTVNYMQGWFFSKPIHFEALKQLVKQNQDNS